jgi:hypothetical protein
VVRVSHRKKVGRIPDGGGWRVHGKGSPQAKEVARGKKRGARTGYLDLHSAMDGYLRLAYIEALSDEKAATAVAFLDRASAGVVDVRDIANVHVRALTDESAAGQRFLGTTGLMSLSDMAATLKQGLGVEARRVSTRTIPDWVVRLAARLDDNARQVVPMIGRPLRATSAKAEQLLGWTPRPKEEAVLATGRSTRWHAHPGGSRAANCPMHRGRSRNGDRAPKIEVADQAQKSGRGAFSPGDDILNERATNARPLVTIPRWADPSASSWRVPQTGKRVKNVRVDGRVRVFEVASAKWPEAHAWCSLARTETRTSSPCCS